MGLTIRMAALDDAEALQLYAERLFAERLPGIYERPAPSLEEEREFIRSHTEPPRCSLLLAEEDGRVVGLLGFMARQLPQEAHVGLLGVSVAQSHRGHGIGTALIDALLDWAPGQGISRVEIEAFAANERAIRLYERLGFEHEGSRRAAVMIDGTPVDVVMMARLVGQRG